MLRELSITNFALIDELRVEFGPGLNVLTGETGAGKSILIDALGLALGTKGEAEQIRTGAEGAAVEAAFDLGNEEARRLLAECGIECLPDEFLAVRRLLLREGKSKAYLNGRLSSAALLRDLAELLIEVHGQHQGACPDPAEPPAAPPRRVCRPDRRRGSLPRAVQQAAGPQRGAGLLAGRGAGEGPAY